jgi:hypothetical protein
VLEPGQRRLLTEALRPPDGYELDHAIATTFSLDLLALLITPLSFALFDWESGEGGVTRNPAALLEAVRRYADRMTIVCQAGQMRAPRAGELLLVHLEDAVHEATAPSIGHLFHPKIWLLRFTPRDGEGHVRYRMLCLSRNLTFDTSWDTAVVLEGELIDRQRGYAWNEPIARLVEALPDLVTVELDAGRRRAHDTMAHEVRRVAWEDPPDVEEMEFHLFGLEGSHSFTGFESAQRSLVVSPFVGPHGLALATAQGRDHVLITRSEELRTADREALGRFSRIAVIADGAALDSAQTEPHAAPESPPLVAQELHAKIYVAEEESKASLFTGSVNATDAAFGGNVEFMVELRGSKRKFGIDAMLKPRDAEEPSFGNLLVDVDLDSLLLTPAVVDEVGAKLDALLRRVQTTIAAEGLVATAFPTNEEGVHDLVISRRASGELGGDVELRCWPIHLGASFGRLLTVSQPPTFQLRDVDISSFVAVEASARIEGRRQDLTFVVNAQLVDAPADRDRLVLRQVLRDKERVLRFLLYLLAAGDARATAEVLFGNDGRPEAAGVGVWNRWAELPIFESLLKALAEDPTKVDRVVEMIHDLEGAEGAEDLLPEGLAELLEPIVQARDALR